MRALIFAAALAAVLGPAAARAQDPCAEDAKRLCPDVRAGSGRVQQCLKQNAAQVSPACGAKMAADEKKIRGVFERFARSCAPDMNRLCSHVKPGGGRMIACLDRNQDRLSTPCTAEVERIQFAREKFTAVRDACRADVERLCPAAPDAASLIECLQVNEAGVSQLCRSIDPAIGGEAAALLDALEALTSGQKTQEALQILQGIDTIAFSRSQILIQFDSFQALGDKANANRLLFNPQIVFGDRNQYSLQLKAPILAVYPYRSGANAQTGLGAVSTAFAWAFSGRGSLQQYASLGLQLATAAQPAVGGAWAVTPAYAISVGLKRWLSFTGQVAWVRSFSNGGYPEVNLLVVEPILVANLPKRAFVALDTRLGWTFVDDSFVPLTKAIFGIFIDRQKSLSISLWYQTALSTSAVEHSFQFDVGTGLAYFFES